MARAVLQVRICNRVHKDSGGGGGDDSMVARLVGLLIMLDIGVDVGAMLDVVMVVRSQDLWDFT